jgi:hypothetical protein
VVCRGCRSWRRWCCHPLWVVLLPARSWAGLSSLRWYPPRGAVLLVLVWQAGHLLLWWSGGGWRWLRVALRPAMAPGAVWMSGQRPRDGGHGEEHHGVWCHGGLYAVAATSCKAGLATSSWWIGFYDSGMGELRAKALHRPRSTPAMLSSLDVGSLVGGIIKELLHLPRCFEPQALRVKT